MLHVHHVTYIATHSSPWRHRDDMRGLCTLPEPRLQGGGRVGEKGEYGRS